MHSLVAESLALLINQDRQIKGITSPAGTESKILQYADNTNIAITDKNGIDRVLTQIAEYSTLTLWKMRGLTLRGKVVVVNSLVFSKLTHTLSV